jgi:general secretion pathway protein N
MRDSARKRGSWLVRTPRGGRASAFAPSTLAELAWQRTRDAASHWSFWGVGAGALAAIVAFAPAAWLASGIASATGQRLLLTDARGTVWSGSAQPVLTGGPGSREAAALPGRLAWTLHWRGLGFELRASQPCCLNGETVGRLRPGFGRMAATLEPSADGWTGRWPAAWLAALGTPWNTLQLGGLLRLSTPGLTLESVQGRWRMTGSAELDVVDASSRLSTLPELGSYRLTVPGSGDSSTLKLGTLEGPLELSGNGQWTPAGVRFRGEARAAEGSQAALDNLLNIIGRRQGERSVISIG